jgi:heat-inducible transcriptional repressor
MIDKKEFLLQSIIKAYIEHLEPIGSSQLKTMYDITYSPATIRGYFKKLGDEGYLAQEHISSGRTPTIEALKEFWISRLNFKLDFVDLEAMKYMATQIGVSVFIKEQKADTLQNILNVEDKYMILEFDSFSITIKYSSALHRFLTDMIGLDINHIVKISKQVGAYELYEQVNEYLQNSSFNIINSKEFLKLSLDFDLDEFMINSFLKGEILDKCDENIYFENLLPLGHIGICHNCKINGKDSKILVVGELSKNYEYFYERIAS